MRIQKLLPFQPSQPVTAPSKVVTNAATPYLTPQQTKAQVQLAQQQISANKSTQNKTTEGQPQTTTKGSLATSGDLEHAASVPPANKLTTPLPQKGHPDPASLQRGYEWLFGKDEVNTEYEYYFDLEEDEDPDEDDEDGQGQNNKGKSKGVWKRRSIHRFDTKA